MAFDINTKYTEREIQSEMTEAFIFRPETGEIVNTLSDSVAMKFEMTEDGFYVVKERTRQDT